MPRGKTAKTKKRERLIFEWAELQNPVTVRQLYYRLSTLNEIDKTDAGYKRIVTICGNMRKEGNLNWSWIVDKTRRISKSRTYSTIEEALEFTAFTYRKALWITQPTLCEIWLEKDALGGVIADITDGYDVPLMATKGYPSLSALHIASEQLRESTEGGKKTKIFYFGDYDPSGKDIPRSIESTLRHKEFAPDADFEIIEVAVTEQQITDWELPSRPTKKSDSRSKNFVGESVELDAIEPAQLRRLVRNCIESVIDPFELESLKKIEKAERESIYSYISSFDAYPKRGQDYL